MKLISSTDGLQFEGSSVDGNISAISILSNITSPSWVENSTDSTVPQDFIRVMFVGQNH